MACLKRKEAVTSHFSFEGPGKAIVGYGGMIGDAREHVKDGINGELKQRKTKKEKMKKPKEKKDVSDGGRERNAGLMARKSDGFGDCHFQRNEDDEQSAKALASTIASTISLSKKQVELDRNADVKTRMDLNNGKLQGFTAHLHQLAEERGTFGIEKGTEAKDLLMDSILRVSGLNSKALENDGLDTQESTFLTLLSISGPGGNSLQPVKISMIEKNPPYTTWIFLDRNQKMVEEQSVVGRRRIYYDQNGSEALICSDSEEEQVDDEDEKHEFSKGEDYILWRTIQEHGLGEGTLKALENCIEASSCEIEARYEALHQADCKEFSMEGRLNVGYSGISKEIDIKDEPKMQDTIVSKMNPAEGNNFDDKDLDAAMDSFDNLFCRRCLVFDCRLHGCSQTVIQPSEKQASWSNPEGSTIPCGAKCHLLASPVLDGFSVGKSIDPIATERGTTRQRNGNEPSENKDGVVDRDDALKKQMKVENEKNNQNLNGALVNLQGMQEPQKTESPRKGRKPKKNAKRRAEEVLVTIRKKQNRAAVCDVSSMPTGPTSPKNITDPGKSVLNNVPIGTSERRYKHRDGLRTLWRKGDKVATMSNRSLKKHEPMAKTNITAQDKRIEEEGDTKIERKKRANTLEESARDTQSMQKRCEEKADNLIDDGSLAKTVENAKWTKLEKDLYEKGLEIFGKNSCLVARNMLKGMKTCIEVAEYIAQNEAAVQMGDGHNSHLDANGRSADCDDAVDLEVRTRTRFWRKRGRVRRLKYTWKSAGHPATRKRIADTKDQPCKQYTPCGCQFICGKQCPCLNKGTCCEKYCGCSRACKNRFRGCHCAKSQCRSRQCPCFAAGRECDPDVCRNCWVGCGDGTLGGPPQRGDNYECQNMKLLLRQQQRVLLGRSDVAGWGAFLKNSVSRHDYLGEYTGELISHREADKRGKIYDRENSSFLFNLNDQYVLDAYRKGDKLKFANHSPNPNCYAKVIMVAGDHRVGIFAKDRISAGEELFYDYRYEPDRAPIWARKPEGSNPKREEPCTTGGRAQKVA